MPELGIGWYPVSAQPYDGAYWKAYRERDASPAGEALTKTRMALVLRHWSGEVCDIGIGGGRFVRSYGNASGFDVNPHAVTWLMDRGLYRDPRRDPCEAATFWDSLEHIHDAGAILANVKRWCFVSLPIFTGPDHILRSKHYKPSEHCWYFTRAGFERFMGGFGWEMREHGTGEQPLREDIESFAFERV